MATRRQVTSDFEDAAEYGIDTAAGAASVAIGAFGNPSRFSRRFERKSHRRGAGTAAAAVRGAEAFARGMTALPGAVVGLWGAALRSQVRRRGPVGVVARGTLSAVNLPARRLAGLWQSVAVDTDPRAARRARRTPAGAGATARRTARTVTSTTRKASTSARRSAGGARGGVRRGARRSG
ncbi:MAG: hypothetical protein NVSMB29_04540 [Candidatus Dormibacteria bacterium]